jgi:hypothetical protein
MSALDNLQDLQVEDFGQFKQQASESLNNSTYYSFFTLFTIYFMHKMISHNMFTIRIISCDLRLRICLGSIVLLSPVALVLLLSHKS